MKSSTVILKKISLIVFLSGIVLSCEKDHVPLGYNLQDSKTLKNGLEFPGGLCEIPDESTKSKSQGIITNATEKFEGILVEGPGFKNLYNDGGIQALQNPRILKYSEDGMGSFTLSEITQIGLTTFFEDLDSYGYYPTSAGKLGDTLWRAKGLTLDGLVLSNKTILVSSNSSDKLFRVNEGGITFYQNPGLRGIIDMILGSDAKIYAVKIDAANNYAKEVISINNETIKSEFQLPPGSTDLKSEAPFIERLKIVENSPLGKEKFGTEFYISDLLTDIIYKVDKNYNIQIFSENINHPSSLTVDSYGSVFYTTTPVISYSAFSKPFVSLYLSTKLCFINPETGIPKEVYSFDEQVEDYYSFGDIWNSSSTGGLFLHEGTAFREAKYLPIGYNVTTTLREQGNSLEFLITNSHQGTLKYLSIIREGG